MCGIAGIALQPNAPAMPDMRERLAAMAQAMLHRGPDDGGVYVAPGGRAGLANRRLAIRDLSPAGHMPMGNAEENLWITYNGEVYNTAELRPELARLGYCFRSHSDTEVILHGYAAWGPKVVERLRGMFAFAILDGRPSAAGLRLFIARDRLGIKPLYYAATPSAFLFASELKALLASGMVSRELSPAGIVGYLLFGAVPNPFTIYRDVKALEPGCTLTLDLCGPLTSPEPRRYWRMPIDTVEGIDHATAVEQVRALLEESVRIRLVSDVPLGAFLSGGLDSSAVVALMRKATDGPIRTCSMVFEEAEYSEAPYAKAMAEAAGAEHYERVITASEILAEWGKILAAMDQPTVDGVNTYFVSQTARQAGLTVALSGLGGDELFGGYASTFAGVPQLVRTLQLVCLVPGASSLTAQALSLLSNRRRLSRIQDALKRPVSPASAYLARRGLFAPSEVRDLVTPEVWADASRTFDSVRHIEVRAAGRGKPESSRGTLFEWTSRAELSTYTHHQLLRDADVMSMAHSLEVRVPLLDHKLVEAVLRLPAAVKRHGNQPKPLLASAIGDLLAPLVRDRRQKQTFTFPFDKWLRGDLKGYLPTAATRSQLFKPGALELVSRTYLQGQVHWSRPWALVVLRAWAG